MPKIFLKTKECGCILKTILHGEKTTDNKDNNMELTGKNKYFSICNKCKQYNGNGNVALDDIIISDNVTNDFKYK